MQFYTRRMKKILCSDVADCNNNYKLFRLLSAMDKFDLKLIPEFDSSPMCPSIVKWFEKAELVCRLFTVKEPATVIPLRLTKGAYAVYQHLKNDADLEEIKRALYTAFGTDSFIAWKQFVGRRLEPGETVDVYLADLRKLAVPFGGATDCILECAFLVGLPDNVSRLLRSSLRLDELGIDELLARARNILKDTKMIAAAARHAASDSAHNATDVVVLTTTPDTVEARVMQEVPIINEHGSNCAAITVTSWAT